MRWICLPMGLLLMMLLPARAGHSAPKIFLAIHVQTTGEGLSPQQATTIRIPPNGEPLQVRALPETTEHDLVDVQPGPAGGVRLFFDHDGQVALSAVTAQNEGRILVVLINGFVIYAPTIDQQITNGELDIPHSLKPETVQLLLEEAKKNVKQANRT